jgi:hypothetical protein
MSDHLDRIREQFTRQADGGRTSDRSDCSDSPCGANLAHLNNPTSGPAQAMCTPPFGESHWPVT